MHERLHVLISGLVQGVGFRHATYRKAATMGLSGWVRNTPDGRVEAVFEGEKPVLEEMLDWCTQGPVLSRVDTVECDWAAAEDGFDQFEIAF